MSIKSSDLMDQLRKTLSSSSPSVLHKPEGLPQPAANSQNLKEAVEAKKVKKSKLEKKAGAKPITITLYPEDIIQIDKYRLKAAGEGRHLNVSEAVRDALKKL